MTRRTDELPIQPRVELRNLAPAQKVLVATILATIGFGYLAALANLFARSAPADGKSSISLEQFGHVVRERGIGGLVHEVHESLGMDDVIRTYHGSGEGKTRFEASLEGSMKDKPADEHQRQMLMTWARLPGELRRRAYFDGLPTKERTDRADGPTKLEAALRGSMKDKILEELAGGEKPDDFTIKFASSLNQMLIDWSRLPVELRQRAYQEGVPINDEGIGQVAAFAKMLASPTDPLPDGVMLEPIIADTINNNCVQCHSSGSPDETASKMPLTTFNEVNVWCQPAASGLEADFALFQQMFGERSDGDIDPKLKLTRLVSMAINDRCVKCHSPGSTDAQARNMPMTTFTELEAYLVEDHGMSYNQLALTTHVHLLGFSVLFAMTGFLFSLTSWPTPIRILFTPWTMLFQMIEIVCWWMAKIHVGYAMAIFYLGPVVGFGLGVQILGTFLDMLIRRRNCRLVDMKYLMNREP